MSPATGLIISAQVRSRAETVLKVLRAAGQTIVTAESCTAGMVSAVLSRVDGAGDILHGGFVTYTKAHKTKALGVAQKLLAERGAVNEDVVVQMALGALERSPASLSVAVSGVLGPEEDEDGNPVGLVFLCAASTEAAPIVVREQWAKLGPEELLQRTIESALNLIERASATVAPARPQASAWTGLIK